MRESVNIGHIQTDAYTVRRRTKEEGQEKGVAVVRLAIAMRGEPAFGDFGQRARCMYGVYTIQGASTTHDVLFPAVCVCLSLFREGR